jgi:hypothetical protein
VLLVVLLVVLIRGATAWPACLPPAWPALPALPALPAGFRRLTDVAANKTPHDRFICCVA